MDLEVSGMRVVLPPGWAGAGAVGGETVDDAALRQIWPLLCLLLSDTEGQRPQICFPIGLVVLLTVDLSLALGSVRHQRRLSFKLQSLKIQVLNSLCPLESPAETAGA